MQSPRDRKPRGIRDGAYESQVVGAVCWVVRSRSHDGPIVRSIADKSQIPGKDWTPSLQDRRFVGFGGPTTGSSAMALVTG